MSWDDKSWREAAKQYHRDRAGWPLIAEIETERLKLLHGLMGDNVSLNNAWHKLNDPRNRPTPQTVIEAVLHAVRERGPAALKEPETRERLSRCDEAARTEINRRIEKPGPQP